MEHAGRDGIVHVNHFPEAEGIVYFEECGTANIIGLAVLFKIGNENCILCSNDFFAVCNHARFPFCMGFVTGCAHTFFGAGVIKAIGKRNAMASTFERLLNRGNCAIEIFAADNKDAHGFYF